MASSTLTLPRTLPTQRFRPPKRNIPQTAIQRNHVLQRVREYVAEHNPVPPLSLEELKRHADAMVALLGCDPVHRDYIGILINNEMWRETLATVPCSRRLLLLPKCLRVQSKWLVRPRTSATKCDNIQVLTLFRRTISGSLSEVEIPNGAMSFITLNERLKTNRGEKAAGSAGLK